MDNKYTEEFLISELHRFVDEHGRIPVKYEMTANSGYISNATYDRRFGSWNNALKVAGLKLNKTQEKRTGLENCCICGNLKKENQKWITSGLQNNEVMCIRCYKKSFNDYLNGNLNVDSSTGFGFLAQRVVAKTLKLKLKNDCNCSVNFRHPYDLYDKNKYGKIDVKARCLWNNNQWEFTLRNSGSTNTFILVGFDENKKNILRVWIVDANDNLAVKKKRIYITNNLRCGLKRAKPWEVESKPYNDAFHAMSIENCSVLTYKE